jgi:hypothetical protein
VIYKTIFQVEGGGEFPMDMLRYDRSAPYTSADASGIAQSIEEKTGRRVVTLIHIGDSAKWSPTFGRWESFRWTCVTSHTERM